VEKSEIGQEWVRKIFCPSPSTFTVWRELWITLRQLCARAQTQLSVVLSVAFVCKHRSVSWCWLPSISYLRSMPAVSS